SVLIEEQDRAKQAGKLGFHNAHEVIQYRLQASIARYHLQDMTLSVTQRLCQPAFGHVHQDSGVFDEVAGRIENRMPYTVHVFRRTIWKNDSKMRLEILSRA